MRLTSVSDRLRGQTEESGRGFMVARKNYGAKNKREHWLLCLACTLFLFLYQDFLPRLCCGHPFPELFSNQEMLRAKNSWWQ